MSNTWRYQSSFLSSVHAVISHSSTQKKEKLSVKFHEFRVMLVYKLVRCDLLTNCISMTLSSRDACWQHLRGILGVIAIDILICGTCLPISLMGIAEEFSHKVFRKMVDLYQHLCSRRGSMGSVAKRHSRVGIKLSLFLFCIDCRVYYYG